MHMYIFIYSHLYILFAYISRSSVCTLVYFMDIQKGKVYWVGICSDGKVPEVDRVIVAQHCEGI